MTNWKWFIIMLLIALGLSLMVGLALPASAYVELHQGDTAYLGETVDISRVIAWPDYKLAWCANDVYGCEPPDQIIQITGYMYNYYLDPNVWHTGTYYRWSGEWSRGENLEAFTILPGTRPTPTPTVTPEANVTPNATEHIIEGPYHYLIARGDNPVINVNISRSDPAHLWMFGSTKQVLDLPMKKTLYGYSYQMTLTDTFSTSVGSYDGYLQFDGRNGLQDVYWNEETKCIETPYRQSLQADVCPDEWNTASVRAEFENMVENGYNSDDVLVKVTMQVTEPEIVITELLRDTDSVWIQGKTTWGDGTTLTLKLDPDNYALQQDIRMHTWNTTIKGELDDYRHFEVSCPIDTDELYVGVHEFKMTVEKNKYVTDVFYTFRITDTYVMPTPTPKIVRVIEDMEGNKIDMTTTVVTPFPTPTPNESVVHNPRPEQQNITVTPIPSITVPTTETVPPTTIATTVPTPRPTADRNITVPLPWWLALMAIPIVWRMKK